MEAQKSRTRAHANLPKDAWTPPWPSTSLSRRVRLPSGRTIPVHGELVALVFTKMDLNSDPSSDWIFDTMHFPIRTVDDVWLMLLFCMYDAMNLTTLRSFETFSGEPDIPVELYVDCLMVAAQCAPSLATSDRSPLIQRVNACFEQKNASCTRMIQRIVERFDPYSDFRVGRLLCAIVKRLEAPYSGIWSFASSDACLARVSTHTILAAVFVWLASLPSEGISGEYIDSELEWIKRYYTVDPDDLRWSALWSVMPVSAVCTSRLAQEWSNQCGISQRLWFPNHQTHLVLARNLNLVLWLPQSSHLRIRDGLVDISPGFNLRQKIDVDHIRPWDRFILPQLWIGLFDSTVPICYILQD